MTTENFHSLDQPDPDSGQQSDQLQRLRADLENEKKEKAGLQERVGSITNEKIRMQNAQDILKAQKDDLESRLKSLNQRLQEKEEELERQRTYTESRQTDDFNKEKQLKAELLKEQEQRAELQEQIENMLEKQNQLENAKDNIRAQKEEVESRLEDVSRQLKERGLELEKEKKIAGNRLGENENLKKERDRLREELECDIAGICERHPKDILPEDDLNKSLQHTNEALGDARTTISRLEEEKKKLVDERDRLKTEKEKLESELSRLKLTIQGMEGAVLESRKENEALELERDRLAKEINTLKKKQEQDDAQITHLRQELDTAMRETDELRMDVEDWRGDGAELSVVRSPAQGDLIRNQAYKNTDRKHGPNGVDKLLTISNAFAFERETLGGFVVFLANSTTIVKVPHISLEDVIEQVLSAVKEEEQRWQEEWAMEIKERNVSQNNWTGEYIAKAMEEHGVCFVGPVSMINAAKGRFDLRGVGIDQVETGLLAVELYSSWTKGSVSGKKRRLANSSYRGLSPDRAQRNEEIQWDIEDIGEEAVEDRPRKLPQHE